MEGDPEQGDREGQSGSSSPLGLKYRYMKYWFTWRHWQAGSRPRLCRTNYGKSPMPLSGRSSDSSGQTDRSSRTESVPVASCDRQWAKASTDRSSRNPTGRTSPLSTSPLNEGKRAPTPRCCREGGSIGGAGALGAGARQISPHLARFLSIVNQLRRSG